MVRIIANFLRTYLKGNPALPMILQLVDNVVRSNEAAAKRKLYALGLGLVFTIELGPLLTALLLAGRIGGSYAGTLLPCCPAALLPCCPAALLPTALLPCPLLLAGRIGGSYAAGTRPPCDRLATAGRTGGSCAGT